MQKRMHPRRASRSGSALVIVLAGLAVLTALYAVASSLLHAHLNTASADMTIAKRAQLNRDIMSFALSLKRVRETPAPSELKVRVHDKNLTVTYVDVGGLIDLNTGDSDLLYRIAEALSLSPSAIDTYLLWRRDSNKATDIYDFFDLTDLKPSERSKAEYYFTVYSGRRGIALEVADSALLEALSGQVGSVSQLQRLVSDDLTAEPSAMNYDIYVNEIVGPRRKKVGTIHLAPNGQPNRILDLR